MSEPTSRREGSSVTRTWNYVWLAYSGFYFIEPVLRRDVRFWVETICLYAIFITIYTSLNRCTTERKQYLLLASLFLLGVADYPRNEGASSFFIYVAGFMPFMLPSVGWVGSLIGVDAVVLFVEGLWLYYHPVKGQYLSNPFNLGISVFFVLVVGVSNLLVAQQKRADSKLRIAEREIVQLAAVADRERIARDLHDVLGHTLSVIVLKAELAGRLMVRDPERAAIEIADVERTARTALSEVREAIGGYRSQGLAAEMSAARKTLDAAGVALTLEDIDTSALAPTLSSELQTVFSLTLREAVTNIVRHAHATHCRVSFTTDAGKHTLSIEDDGTHALIGEGNGLRGMRERVQRLGGSLSLDRTGGTTVRIDVPASAVRSAIS